MTKSYLRRRAFVHLTACRPSPREVKAGAWGRKWSEAWSSGLIQPAFLQYPGLPAQGRHPTQWTGRSRTTIKKKSAPQGLPAGQSSGGFFSVESFSSKRTLAVPSWHNPRQQCFQPHSDRLSRQPSPELNCLGRVKPASKKHSKWGELIKGSDTFTFGSQLLTVHRTLEKLFNPF